MRLGFEDPRSVRSACQECWHFNLLSSVRLVWPTSRRTTGWQVCGGRREQRFWEASLHLWQNDSRHVDVQDRAFMSPVKPLSSHPPLVLHMTLIPSASPKSSHKHHSTNKSSSWENAPTLAKIFQINRHVAIHILIRAWAVSSQKDDSHFWSCIPIPTQVHFIVVRGNEMMGEMDSDTAAFRLQCSNQPHQNPSALRRTLKLLEAMKYDKNRTSCLKHAQLSALN